MLSLELTCKSTGDQGKPTINTSSLVKAGLLRNYPATGTKVIVGLVNSGGVTSWIDFYASRDGKTLYAKNGFNFYLFGKPTVGNPIKANCCGVDLDNDDASYDAPSTVRTTTVAERSRTNHVYLGIKALLRVLKNHNGNKTAAATEIGCSPRTFGRMLEAASKTVATSTRTSSKKSNGSKTKSTRKVTKKKSSRRR